MKYIIILLAWLLGGSLSLTSGNLTENKSGQKNGEAYCECNDSNYTYVYVWIDGVRWLFIYNKDGAVINAYPDPED